MYVCIVLYSKHSSSKTVRVYRQYEITIITYGIRCSSITIQCVFNFPCNFFFNSILFLLAFFLFLSSFLGIFQLFFVECWCKVFGKIQTESHRCDVKSSAVVKLSIITDFQPSKSPKMNKKKMS